MTKGTLFFDYDGTLHDSMRLYGPALRKAYQGLVDAGHCEPRELSDDFVASWLGWTVEDMWRTFQPDLPEEAWRPASRVVGEEMTRLMGEGKAALFDGIPAALDALKAEGFCLVFLSNCRQAYRDAHRHRFGLDRWFDAYHCAEDFDDIPKWRIYQEVAASYPKPHVMVGDRFHDIEVATKAGIPAIGCAFGFGRPEELTQADVVIRHPGELPSALARLIAE